MWYVTDPSRKGPFFFNSEPLFFCVLFLRAAMIAVKSETFAEGILSPIFLILELGVDK